MSEEVGRKRKPRFIEKEVEVMVDKIWDRSDTLFNRFSDTVTNKKKKMAWSEVLDSVNAASVTPRSIDELKKKWDDIKRITKKKASDLKKDRQKTGGGEVNVPALSQMEEKIVSLIGEEKIYGLTDGVDLFQQQCETQEESICPMPSSATNCRGDNSSYRGENQPQLLQLKSVPPKPAVSSRTSVRAQTEPNNKSENLSQQKDELLQIEKQRLGIDKERLQIERNRLQVETQRVAELKRIADAIEKMQKPVEARNSEQPYQDYSYLYASLQ